MEFLTLLALIFNCLNCIMPVAKQVAEAELNQYEHNEQTYINPSINK